MSLSGYVVSAFNINLECSEIFNCRHRAYFSSNHKEISNNKRIDYTDKERSYTDYDSSFISSSSIRDCGKGVLSSAGVVLSAVVFEIVVAVTSS